MFFITGDTHGNFDRIEDFVYKMRTTKDDVMIILGDAGINYYLVGNLDGRSRAIKKMLADFPITFFCIHGNHEERPYNVEGYELQEHFGAPAYVNPEFPNQIFAKDGEFYNLNGYKTLVIGGAYSVDKWYRLAGRGHWFPSEQPTEEIKSYVEKQLDDHNWNTDIVLTHTCPVDTEPRHLFLPFIDQESVDKSTEQWLQTIADKTEFKKWYFGHFHGDWQNGKYEMLFENIKEFKL